MTPKQALSFVRRHGVVLQAARGPVPNLAEAIAGAPIRGSWWGHPSGRDIFHAIQYLCENPEVLVCKLVDGKVTFVHRRLWPALVKLAPHFPKDRLAKVWDEHTSSGAHVSRSTPFPNWVPDEIISQAKLLSESKAEKMLSSLGLSFMSPRRISTSKKK